MARRRKKARRPLAERLFRNKYFLVFLGFAVWMVFFDRHDLPTQVKLNRALMDLENDKAYYRDKIEETKTAKETVASDKGKYAREEYYMSQPKEEVFIIVKE